MRHEESLYRFAAQVRQHLHQEPELSMQEHETTEYLCRQMEAMGCAVTRWDDLTGAVGLIRGAHPGPTIAIRADIDALPIQENSGNPFPSRRAGVMHACAHDGHTAIALTAGRYFAQRREQLHGNVKLIFQPAEEQLPGGAKPMIGRGVLKAPDVDAIFALHHVCILPQGEIGVYPCEALIGVSRFRMVVEGPGGYGGEPHKGTDSILAAGEIMDRVRGQLIRCLSPETPAVVTFGTISGGEFAGGLARNVALSGTARTFSLPAWRQMRSFLETVIREVERELGVSVSLEYEEGYPPVYNDFDAAWLVKSAAAECLGAERVKVIRGPLAGSDDMAFFLEQVPGCYFWWGVGPLDGSPMRAHNPAFDFADAAMEPAVDVMITAVEKALVHFGPGEWRRYGG